VSADFFMRIEKSYVKTRVSQIALRQNEKGPFLGPLVWLVRGGSPSLSAKSPFEWTGR
jgi:hypothetical protein